MSSALQSMDPCIVMLITIFCINVHTWLNFKICRFTCLVLLKLPRVPRVGNYILFSYALSAYLLLSHLYIITHKFSEATDLKKWLIVFLFHLQRTAVFCWQTLRSSTSRSCIATSRSARFPDTIGQRWVFSVAVNSLLVLENNTVVISVMVVVL